MRHSEAYRKHAIYLAPTRPTAIRHRGAAMPGPARATRLPASGHGASRRPRRSQRGIPHQRSRHGDAMGSGGMHGQNQRAVSDPGVGGDPAPVSVPHPGLSCRQWFGVHQRRCGPATGETAGGIHQITGLSDKDNALVEGKNGAVIRKHMGYQHIGGEHAEAIQKYHTGHLNPYLNNHRPCGFATVTVNQKGKRKRVYRIEDYATPYAKLKLIPQAEQYLKAEVTWEKLDRLAGSAGNTEFAQRIMRAKSALLRKCRGQEDLLPPRP